MIYEQKNKIQLVVKTLVTMFQELTPNQYIVASLMTTARQNNMFATTCQQPRLLC